MNTQVKTYEVRDPSGTLKLETLDQKEAESFARVIFSESGFICDITEQSRKPVDHTKAR